MTYETSLSGSKLIDELLLLATAVAPGWDEDVDLPAITAAIKSVTDAGPPVTMSSHELDELTTVVLALTEEDGEAIGNAMVANPAFLPLLKEFAHAFGSQRDSEVVTIAERWLVRVRDHRPRRGVDARRRGSEPRTAPDRAAGVS